MGMFTYASGFYWKDVLNDDTTQRYLQQETMVELEQRIHRHSEWQRTHREAICMIGCDPKPFMQLMIEQAPNSEAAARVSNIAAWIGAERGQRVGRERGERMIKEAYAFSASVIAMHAPWLDGED